MKKGKILLSGVLSLAAFSLFTNVNAESYVVSSLPETFTTRDVGRVGNSASGFTVDETKDAILNNQTIVTLNGSSGNEVIDYHTTTGLKPFCIDRTIAYVPSKEYVKDSEITDRGLIYIIYSADSYYDLNLADSAVAVNASLEVTKQMELSWMTQVAVWQYLDSTFAAPYSGIATEIRDGSALTGSDFYYYSRRASQLWTKASELVAAAKNIKAGFNPASVSSITFSFDGNYELNKDTKMIKTGLITQEYVSGDYMDSFTSLDLTKAPEGTKMYAKDGTELDSNKFNGPFYLEFPIDNVDEYSFDFDVSATVSGYTYYTGYKYIPKDGGNYQPLVLVTKNTKNLTGAINFKGSHIDDTASMISRSIYFVGFLILVAGVAMIYVNVRPRTSKEQI